MKNILRITAGLGVMLFASGTMQAQFTLQGDIMPRTEYRHGYQAPLDSLVQGNWSTGQRTRLNFGYKSEKIKAKVSLQDVRTWGSTAQLNATDGFASLHEGWAQYYFTSKFSLKAGRQEVTYDDERLFGGVGWTFQGRSHDMFLFGFEDTAKKFTGHLGLAYNQAAMANLPAAYTINNYKEMYYLWMNKKFGNFGASLLGVITGTDIPNDTNATHQMQTLGTHLEYKKDALFGSLRGYYQMGHAMVGTARKELAAYMFGFDFKYTLAKKFTAGLGIEMMSGQSQTDTTKAYKDVQHAFNPLYGTGHKFNGYMDYFYAGNAHGSVGLQDIYVNLKYKGEKYWVGADVHLFSAAAGVLDKIDSTGIHELDKNLGTEIDLTFNYAFSKQFAIQCGYSHYLHTEAIAKLKGVLDYQGKGYTGNTANWAYIMLVFKPDFIK